MSSEIIPIFGGLRLKDERTSLRGSNRDAMYVEFRAPDLVGVFDDEWCAALVSAEVVTVIKQNTLVLGRGPEGTPLPRISPATEERRDYRAEQARRGGKPAKRFRKRKNKGAAYKDAVKNYRKRFYNDRIEGGVKGIHVPSAGTYRPNLVSLESGLLWRSTASAPISAGVWGVFFANVRALLDGKGGSPIGRVSKRIPMWSAKGMRQPQIQKRLQMLAKSMITQKAAADEIVAAAQSKDVARMERALAKTARLDHRSKEKFMGALSDTVKNVFALGKDLQDFGDSGYAR